jgi:hypothetical protein
MSAEILRRAASLMRERARRAERAVEISGPWGTTWDHQVIASDGAQMADCFDSGLLAEHIASWHPAVALAVADLLTTISWFPSSADPTDMQAADAVARAYLGDAP